MSSGSELIEAPVQLRVTVAAFAAICQRTSQVRPLRRGIVQQDRLRHAQQPCVAFVVLLWFCVAFALGSAVSAVGEAGCCPPACDLEGLPLCNPLLIHLCVLAAPDVPVLVAVLLLCCSLAAAATSEDSDFACRVPLFRLC